MKLIILLLFLLSYTISAEEKFKSIYTDISKDCKYEKEDNIPEGSDAPLHCKGPGGYTVIISYSACMEFMRITSKDGKETVEFSAQPIGSADKRKIEWRILNKKPVGVIYRMSILKDSPNENCPQSKIGKEALEIRGLGKFSELQESTPSEKKGNEKAREILETFVKRKE